jgi:hypothetical protein
MKTVFEFSACQCFRLWTAAAVLLCTHTPDLLALEVQVDESGVTHYVMQTNAQTKTSVKPELAQRPFPLKKNAVQTGSTKPGTLWTVSGVRFVSSTEPELRSMDVKRHIALKSHRPAASVSEREASLEAVQRETEKQKSEVNFGFAESHINAPWTSIALGNLSVSARSRALSYWPLMVKAGAQFKLDPLLIQSVIHAESAFNPMALSPKGAMGLMQLMPATARRMGVAEGSSFAGDEWRIASLSAMLQQPEVNIQAGSKYLAYLMQLFEGDMVLAVAAYNAGEGAVQRAGRRIPPYPETQAYVRKVLALYTKSRQQVNPVLPDLVNANIEQLVPGPI